MNHPRPTTRLAPSPTGALHLGNARTFLVNWALARRSNWNVILRIEDLDGPRVKPGTIESVIDTLRWLGMDWDGEPLVQSRDLNPYLAAMVRLAHAALAYPSDVSRAQLEELAGDAALSAPQEGSHESVFPAALRPPVLPRAFNNSDTNWRFVVPDVAVTFEDDFSGPHAFHPARTIGDFVIWTKRGQPAYQLAVVVDDHRQGVTHVVRGNDLLESAARQRLLYSALGYTPLPRYLHLPLVRGPDGKRLAKRHGDTRVEHYRAQGVAPERLIGLIGFWCGLPGPRRPMALREFMDGLDLVRMDRSDVVFKPEDDAWLLGR